MKQALDIVFRDARDAAGGIRRRPGFTALAILTLALGIGVNGAALTTAYGILVRPLPFDSPERIVVFNLLFPDGGDLGFSPSDVDEWLRRLDGADAAAAYYTRDVTGRAGARSTVVRAAFVTDQFFDVLRSKPDLGHARLSRGDATVALAHGRVHELLGEDAAQAAVKDWCSPRPVATGLGCGALAAHGLSSLLYGVRQYDLVTFGGTAVVVTSLSLLMTALCAVRTLRVDPIAVLRQDA